MGSTSFSLLLATLLDGFVLWSDGALAAEACEYWDLLQPIQEVTQPQLARLVVLFVPYSSGEEEFFHSLSFYFEEVEHFLFMACS